MEGKVGTKLPALCGFKWLRNSFCKGEICQGPSISIGFARPTLPGGLAAEAEV